ncbi:MAG: hypothetical protein PHF63_01810 [Herbinix sp.]|nr:hypothetical protein [Herbinix sp.]
MVKKNKIADEIYTYIKNAVKISLVLIPGMPSKAKIIEPALDIIFKNLQWSGLLANKLTDEQNEALGKAIKNTSKSVRKSISKNKRELIDRAWPEIEAILQSITTEQLASYDNVSNNINIALRRPSNLESKYLTDQDFNELITLFLYTLEKNLDNTPIADVLNREKMDAMRANFEFLSNRVTELEVRVKKIEDNNQVNDAVEITNEKLNDLINSRRSDIKNSSLIPWFNDSIAYRKAFPRLFIPPEFMATKTTKQMDYDGLLSLYNENLIILGLAGAGKTTLLKYIFSYAEDIHKNIKTIFMDAHEIKNGDKKSLEQYAINAIYECSDTTQELLIVIDGIDEAFFNDRDAFLNLLGKIQFLTRCKVWLGCRSDYFGQAYRSKYDNVFYECLTIQPWDDNQADRFIEQYSDIVEDPHIPDQINSLILKNKNIEKFKHNPFQLTLLVFLMQYNKQFNYNIDSLYDLYEKFLITWIKKEQERGTSQLDEDKIKLYLYEAARKIYNGETYIVETSDTAVCGLLNIDDKDPLSNSRKANSFYHRSLSAYFLAHHVIKVMKQGGIELVKALSHKLLDDVTDFVRDGLDSLDYSAKELIFENMKRLYKASLKQADADLADDIKNCLLDLSEEKSLILRDEIVYFSTRIGLNVSDFVAYAYSHETHAIMRLCIAYGAVTVGPDYIALEYAKLLKPGTEEDLTNRSWTMTYFDVTDKNPYEYIDNEQRPWTAARTKRLKRFKSKNPSKKDYRFRLFDIPLLYCFYVNRNWNPDDLSKEDLEIIKGCTIPNEYFNNAEIEFLKSSKSRLVNEYKKNLAQKQNYIKNAKGSKQKKP